MDRFSFGLFYLVTFIFCLHAPCFYRVICFIYLFFFATSPALALCYSGDAGWKAAPDHQAGSLACLEGLGAYTLD